MLFGGGGCLLYLMSGPMNPKFRFVCSIGLAAVHFLLTALLVLLPQPVVKCLRRTIGERGNPLSLNDIFMGLLAITLGICYVGLLLAGWSAPSAG